MSFEADAAPASRAANLQALLELTDAVQVAISDGDWQKAAMLETERRAMLEAYLDRERAVNGGLTHLSEELAGLQSRANRMIGELHHHRRRLEREAGQLARGRRAVRAYLDEAQTPR